jgi:hypothetical protein
VVVGRNMSGKMPENPLRMSFKRNPGWKTGKIPRGRGKYLSPNPKKRPPNKGKALFI